MAPHTGQGKELTLAVMDILLVALSRADHIIVVDLAVRHLDLMLADATKRFFFNTFHHLLLSPLSVE